MSINISFAIAEPSNTEDFIIIDLFLKGFLTVKAPSKQRKWLKLQLHKSSSSIYSFLLSPCTPRPLLEFLHVSKCLMWNQCSPLMCISKVQNCPAFILDAKCLLFLLCWQACLTHDSEGALERSDGGAGTCCLANYLSGPSMEPRCRFSSRNGFQPSFMVTSPS